MTDILKYAERKQRVDEQAELRFQQRRDDRDETIKAIATKGPMEADTRERAMRRPTFINDRDGAALERIIGKSDLLAINYLDLGMKAARSVCRIQVRDETGRVMGFGTGCLVSPCLLLTNNHVLDRIEHSRRSLADFNFEDDATFIPKETKTFPLEPDRFFYTNEDLDFTLVAVRPTATDGTALDGFAFLRLKEETGKVLLGEYVTIIQHPDGATKQITLRENEVVDISGSFIHYLTDTKPGSSGSPVFSDQWNVVALHHAGVKKRDAQGQVLSVSGQVWEPRMGEDAIAWVANEGVRASSICQDLRNSLGRWERTEQRELLTALLSGTAAPTPPAPLQIEVKEQALEWYEGSGGYDPDFLSVPVPLPSLSPDLQADVVPLKDGSGYELRYTHFSVIMCKSRKLALFTAVNIDGDLLVKLGRPGERWYLDPRIDTAYQSGSDLYERNDLDRGHLVRRLDPVWGEDAADANEDTFHFTNCSPQHKKLNQQTWQGLEDYILKNAAKHGLRVTVFTGPVFRDDDMLYRGKYQIPAEYWKVVAVIKDNDMLSATAYLQTQKNLIEDLEFAYGEYRTYQVPVVKIESLTGLDFGQLRDRDPLSGIEGTLGRVIAGPNDIRL